jgi:pimeloyl-ACP methyl ester carboxylesterase
MPVIDLSGQRLAYRDEGRGPVLVMLSANPGDSRDFDAVAPKLAERLRVIRPDWPGYGSSPAPEPVERTSPIYYFEVLCKLLDALDIHAAHFIGNSIGGNVAVRYAITKPERVLSLVLVSSGGFTAHNAVSRLFCKLMGKPGFNRAIRGAFTRASFPVHTAWSLAMIERALGEQATPIANAVNAANWRGFIEPEHDLREAARAVRAPTLVMNGRRDRALPPDKDGRATAEAIPGARLLVPDCGHAPFAELPDWFLDTVNSFWASLPASAAVLKNARHAAA